MDDHAGFRAILRTFLPEPSPDVVECSDGSEAVAAYAAHQPDWTLMDIAMPGMDGFSATRAIRSQFPDARIIIVTQADSQDLREEASAAGATAYILKDRLSDVAVVISSLCPPPGCNQI